MKIAFLNGLIGLGLGLAIGSNTLGLKNTDIFLCVLSSNVAFLIALLLTLQSERVFKKWLNRSAKTWALVLTLYGSMLIVLAPPLRNLHTLLYLSIPLILSTGFAIMVFGPIQDHLVRRDQRRTLEQK